MRHVAALTVIAILVAAAIGAEQEQAPASPDTLAAAEALYAGTGGTYDLARARELFESAAATGDPVASYRLALVLRFKPSAAGDENRAVELHRGSRRAVEALAHRGDSYAQYLLGSAALAGLGGPVDYHEARRWLERAAPGNESWAWHNLAWMLESGYGVETSDPAGAAGLYRKGAELGNVASMHDLGRLLGAAASSVAACREGRQWLERAATAGLTKSSAFLGKALLYGRGECVASDPGSARRWLEAAAAADEPGAAYDLGVALLTGAVEGRDPKRALELFEHAAPAPELLAYQMQVLLYATGLGGERDIARARRLLAEGARRGSDGLHFLAREASNFPVVRGLWKEALTKLEALADGGDPFATALLANVLYLRSDADSSRALELARHGADAGEADAMRSLAHAYQYGNGVATDVGEAVRRYRQCAEAGDSFCMMFLAHLLMNGELVERDLAAGLAWLVRSGEAGNWWAVADLGQLYDEGWHGLARDEAQAARWKQIAARTGNAEARGWLLYHGYTVD